MWLWPQRSHHKGDECVLDDPARGDRSHAMLIASKQTRDAECESAEATGISQRMLCCVPGGQCGQGAGQRL